MLHKKIKFLTVVAILLTACHCVTGDQFTDNGGFYILCNDGTTVSAGGTDITHPSDFCIGSNPHGGLKCVDNTGNGCTSSNGVQHASSFSTAVVVCVIVLALCNF